MRDSGRFHGENSRGEEFVAKRHKFCSHPQRKALRNGGKYGESG